VIPLPVHSFHLSLGPMMVFTGQFRQIPCAVDQHNELAQLRCRCQFGPDFTRTHPCKVDTGASLTAIPKFIWSNDPAFRKKDIESLPKPDVPFQGVNGKPVDCRVGKADLLIMVPKSLTTDAPSSSGSLSKEFDQIESEILHVGDCTVLFLMDDTLKGKYILLGLGGGTLRKGGLCIDWGTPAEAGRPAISPHAVFIERG
jgi:hypothetical protein